jgi:hypothetical protein
MDGWYHTGIQDDEIVRTSAYRVPVTFEELAVFDILLAT